VQKELQSYSISCISNARLREELYRQESQDGLPGAITNISHMSYAGDIKLRAYKVKNHQQGIQAQTIDHISLVRDNFPLCQWACQQRHFEKSKSSFRELKSRPIPVDTGFVMWWLKRWWAGWIVEVPHWVPAAQFPFVAEAWSREPSSLSHLRVLDGWAQNHPYVDHIGHISAMYDTHLVDF
jgi:hypothetical protein